MTSARTLLGIGSGEGGKYTKNPLKLDRWRCRDLYSNVAGTTIASDLAFWTTQFDTTGISTNDAFTADSYRTVLNHTGAGELVCLVAPSTTNVVTYRFTIDGVVTTIACDLGGTGAQTDQRLVLGQIWPTNGNVGGTVASGSIVTFLYGYSPGKYVAQDAGKNFISLDEPALPSLWNREGNVLYWETSCLIEVKLSNSQAIDGTDQKNRTGVIYKNKSAS
jgi:hypothetical protein